MKRSKHSSSLVCNFFRSIKRRPLILRKTAKEKGKEKDTETEKEKAKEKRDKGRI